MEFKKDIWTKEDIAPFMDYLASFSQAHKEDWGRRILNTKLPLFVLPTKQIQMIVKEIMKGNYRSFLDLRIFTHYETIAIYGMIVSKISSFSEMQQYLEIYKEQMENWAHCDLLNFSHIKEYQNEFLTLSKEYRNSPLPFVRRLSLFILFLLIKEESYVIEALQALESIKVEENYYVIMMGGWLLSECFICYPKQTIEFIKTHEILPAILNKGIQKCRESNRLTQTQKDDLLIYKKKRR